MVIQCHECKGSVSTEAAACPHCGAPVPPNAPAPTPTAPVEQQTSATTTGRRMLDRLGLLLVALVIVGVVGWFYLGPSGRQEAQQVAKNVVGAEQTMMDETFDLAAGGYRNINLQLPREARLRVQLAVREGSAVDVYLMTPQEHQEFTQASQKLLGGNFHYRQNLSRSSVREYADAAVLPPGEWYLVVRSTDQVGVLVGRSARVYLKVTAQG